MKVQFGNPCNVSTATEALSFYDDNEFMSPTRSTIPLLDLLIHSPDVFKKIVRECGAEGEFDVTLEYKVKPFKGKGNASHTDAMVISNGRALAIEAKWTENMYDNVEEWLKKGNGGENRKAVLNGWLECLQRIAPHRLLKADEFNDATYQMVHRAASAVEAARRAQVENSAMLYLLFSRSHCASATRVKKAMEHLWGLLGNPPKLPFYLVEVAMSYESAYGRMERLPKKTQATADQIRGALQGDSALFSFKQSVIQITGP